MASNRICASAECGVEHHVAALGRRVLAGIGVAEAVHLEHGAQQARQRAEGQRGGVRLTAGKDDIGVLTRGDRGELVDQATLAQPGGTDNPDEAAATGVEHVS